MTFRSLLFLFSAGLLILAGCDRDEEIQGCTHHLAENHDPRATVDDGSCTYSEESQLIWKDGQPGGWNGNLTTYGFVPQVCSGDLLAEEDSNGVAPARLYTDASGNLEFHVVLTNPRTARNYNEGFVRFEVLKPEVSSLTSFRIYTHGKLTQMGSGCNEFNRSQVVELSALSLNDSIPASVAVPFSDFDQLMLADINVLFGVIAEGQPDTEVLQINNIRWTRF